MRTREDTARGTGRSRRAVWLTVAIPLMFAACAQVPEWQGKPELNPSLPSKLSAITPSAHSDWPQSQWWQRYEDAELNRLVEEALAHAPDMAVAAARVRQAQEFLGLSQSSTAPQLSANVSASGDKLSYNHLTPAEVTPRGMNDYGRATLDLSWSLDLWGKHRAAVAAAAGELQAREADAAQARLVLASSVAAAYADLVRLTVSEQTLAQSLQVRETTAKLFAERFDNGLENKGSVSSAQARAAAVRAEWLQVQEQVALQRHRIAALIGANPDRGTAIQIPAKTLEQPWQQQWALPDLLPASLLGRRPDVVAARLQAQALESRAAAKQAEFYPNVNLAAFVGVQSLGLNMLTQGGSSVASIGPAINLPIFNGGHLRAQLGVSRAQYEEAVALYRITLNNALHEVADNAIRQRALQQQLVAAQHALEFATQAHRVASNRYKGGLATHLDVLSAEDQMLASVRQLVDMQARALSLDIALNRALGGGWQAEDSTQQARPLPAAPQAATTAPHG